MSKPKANEERFDSETVGRVLAQVARDKAQAKASARALRTKVRKHFSALAGTSLSLAERVNPTWYRGSLSAPDYVLYHSHTCYVSCQVPWLCKRFDVDFPHPKHLFRHDAEVMAGFRVTEDVPGLGKVVVDIFEEAVDHQGFF